MARGFYEPAVSDDTYLRNKSSSDSSGIVIPEIGPLDYSVGRDGFALEG